MLRCVSLRVLAGSCSLSPPSGGGVRAPLPAAPLCGAVAGFRGASAAAAASRSVPRGGAAPRAVAPRRSLRPARPRAAALRSGRGRPRAARACFSPAPARPSAAALSLRSLRGVLAPLLRGAPPPSGRRRAPVRGRRGAPPRPLFPRLSALGGFAASFPLRVARRLSPLCGFGSGRPRRASVPLRRRAAVGRPRGGLAAAAAAAAVFGALRPPAWGLGFAPLRRRFFRSCCGALLRRVARLPCLRLRLPSRAAVARRPPRSGFARAARLPCLRLRLPSRAVGRATAARPDCAFGAFVVQGENWMQDATASTAYCADYSLDIPYTGEFGKTRIILPNYLWISSIDTAPYFWYAHIRNRGGRYGLYGCAAGAARLFDLS